MAMTTTKPEPTFEYVSHPLADLLEMNSRTLEKILSVPDAGRKYFGLHRAEARGGLPTIRIGRRLQVSVVALERMLEETRPTTREAT